MFILLLLTEGKGQTLVSNDKQLHKRQHKLGHIHLFKRNRQFADTLATYTGSHIRYTDWYSVPSNHVLKNGGKVMLNRHMYGCVSEMVCDLYPEYNWLVWEFASKPVDWLNSGQFKLTFNRWNGLTCERLYVEWLGRQKFFVQQLDDWCQIQNHRLIEYFSVLPSDTNMKDVLARVFPEHDWDTSWQHISPKKHLQNQKRFFSLAFTHKTICYRGSEQNGVGPQQQLR